ncbi:MAG: hypothetical protein CL946_02155, partial [Ectothiorhodospiraceae bacterium]|nr:hypothetical protein [Ectothiorhodospiraceae bacterium]
VLPTIASLLFFDDLPAALQVIGIILAFAALPFATKQPIGKDWRVLIAGGFGWGLLLFFAFGLVEFLFKIQKELLPVDNSYQFLSLIFPIAFLTAVVLVVIKKQRVGLHEVGTGAVLGVVNFFSAYFFVLALKELPGVFVYPTNGVAIILLTTVTGILFWKERVTKRNMVFIAIASLALALLYQG